MHINMQPQEVRQALIQYLLGHKMIREDQKNVITFKFTNTRNGKGLITEAHFPAITPEPMGEEISWPAAIAEDEGHCEEVATLNTDMPVAVAPVAVGGSLFSSADE